MTKTEIITASENIFNQFWENCLNMDDTLFFKKPEKKWSAAENMQHLILSTKATALAYRLPRFIVRWIAGTPNRLSRTYEGLKERYYQKLSEGGKASSPFVPKPMQINQDKQKLLDNWKKSTNSYLKALLKNRTEKDLDRYLVKHPLLGRITLRELCYFTIFHTEHHLHSIKNL